MKITRGRTTANADRTRNGTWRKTNTVGTISDHHLRISLDNKEADVPWDSANPGYTGKKYVKFQICRKGKTSCGPWWSV
ncbi:hypothetical protein AB5J62_17585 [Amycolatopsis sp. cg5]|uniref:hypothetical protein n=1 Tax=Amycolatopsis sp. cg5 TaxID=3238802 RepID=UPI00352654FA